MVSVFLYSVVLLVALAKFSWAFANITVDDTDLGIVYSTYPTWDTNVWNQQSPQPLYGTNHGSPNPGAWARFDFWGNAIYVYGYKNTDQGFRNFTIDSGGTVRCDGRTGQLGSRALLFSRSGLTLGSHSIIITNAATQGEYVNIDYFLVTNTSSPLPTPRPKASLPVGTIIGIAAGGGTFILWLCATACICVICRRRRMRRDEDARVLRKAGPRPVSPPSSTTGFVSGGNADPRFSQLSGGLAAYYANNPGLATRPGFTSYQYSPPPTQTRFSGSYPASTNSALGPEMSYPATNPQYPVPRPLSATSIPSSMISQPNSTSSQQMSSLASGSQQLATGAGGRPNQVVAVNELDAARSPIRQLSTEKLPQKVPPAPQSPQTPAATAREATNPSPTAAAQSQGPSSNNGDHHEAPPSYTE